MGFVHLPFFNLTTNILQSSRKVWPFIFIFNFFPLNILFPSKIKIIISVLNFFLTPLPKHGVNPRPLTHPSDA